MIMMVVYNHGIQPVSPNEQNKVLVSTHIKIDEILLKAYYHQIGFTLLLSATILWKDLGEGRSPLVSIAVQVLECPYINYTVQLLAS